MPLAFGRAHGDITLSDEGAVATIADGDDEYRAAASKAAMRSGRHYAHFTVIVAEYVGFGMIRPDWDVEGGESAEGVDGHCFYFTDDGNGEPGGHDWEGSQTAMESDRIGMLLDLDQGSMTVWKNDVKLGVMVAEGLRGPLCWAVSMFDEGYSVRIESAPAPASPTEEELAAAKA